MADSEATKDQGVLKKMENVTIFERVSKREVASVCRQLSVLIDVGQPLLGSLRMVANRQTNGKLRQILNETADKIEQGNSLSSALAEYPHLFSELFLSIIRVGEVSGSLDLALRKLADFLERELRNRNRIVANLLYPALAMIVMLIVVVLVSAFVLPQFEEAFVGMNPDVELPFITVIVFAFGAFLLAFWWLVIFLILAIAGGGWFALTRTSGGKRFRDKMALNFPLVRRLGRRVATVRFTESLSLLIKSGITLPHALRILYQTSDNTVVSDAVKDMAADVEKGVPLAESIQKSKVFPPLVVDMVAIGDDAGALDVVLDKVSAEYNDQIDVFLDTFTSLIEPVLIVILGGVVLVLALAIYLPMWVTSQQAYGRY